MNTRVLPFRDSAPFTSRWISNRYSFASGVDSNDPPSIVYASHRIVSFTRWYRTRVFSTLITFAYIPAVIAAFSTFSSVPFLLNTGSFGAYERGKNRMFFNSSIN